MQWNRWHPRNRRSRFAELRQEGQAIVNSAVPGARRDGVSGLGSYGAAVELERDSVNRVEVEVGGRGRVDVRRLLVSDLERARDLHEKDRVQTYGSACIAEYREIP